MSCNKVLEIKLKSDKVLEIKFYGFNHNGQEIYKTKKGTPIIKLSDDGCFYSIASLDSPDDIDGEPCYKLDSSRLKIVENFS